MALLAVLAVAAISLYSLNVPSQEVEGRSFEAWKSKFKKKYAAEEEAYRIRVWVDNLAFVESHNSRFKAGVETFEVEMNEFADMPSEEFTAKYLIKFPEGKTTKCTGSQAPTANLPDEVDWTTKNVVTGVKNQGQCGSCWAFSTTGSLEGVYAIKKGEIKSFSEQQLVDCSKDYGNQGCGGGLMNLSFFYVKDHGITTEDKYPYRGIGSSCKYNEETDKVWSISDCTEVTVDNEKALMAAIALNPVSVAIEANHISFQLYKSGVYSGRCGTKLDHGVLAAGYGTENGKKYYKVKNSWGSGWGSAGYILIERTGDGKGKCGIQMAASFPIA